MRLVRYAASQGDFAFQGQMVTQMWELEFIVAVPHVKQVKLSNAGGRLVIASGGIWDALSSDMAAQSCQGLPAELAAKFVVKAG